jgi:hypothetical protein
MEGFLRPYTDGNVHVLNEHFRRGVRTMGGSFQLGNWDQKTKKWRKKVTIHWKYVRGDPTWTIRELKMKGFWPIVDPWIKARLFQADAKET